MADVTSGVYNIIRGIGSFQCYDSQTIERRDAPAGSIILSVHAFVESASGERRPLVAELTDNTATHFDVYCKSFIPGEVMNGYAWMVCVAIP